MYNIGWWLCCSFLNFMSSFDTLAAWMDHRWVFVWYVRRTFVCVCLMLKNFSEYSVGKFGFYPYTYIVLRLFWALDGPIFMLTADALLRINNFVECGGFIRFLFCCVRLYSLSAISSAWKRTHIFNSKIVYYSHYCIHSEREAIANFRCHQIRNENSLFGIFIVEMFQKLLQFGYSITFYNIMGLLAQFSIKCTVSLDI